MPGRTFSAGGYRYGFNGKENDNDVKGEGNQQDYGMRIYDTRIAKFMSVDPLSKKYPELTPYQFASNRPIDGIDLDGLEFFKKDNTQYTLDYKPVLKAPNLLTGADNAAHNVLAVVWNGTIGGLFEVGKSVNNYFASGGKIENNSYPVQDAMNFANDAYRYHSETSLKKQLKDFGGAFTEWKNYEIIPGLLITHKLSPSNTFKPAVSNQAAPFVGLGRLREPAIKPGFGEARLLSYSEGLGSRQWTKFTNVVTGNVNDPATRYLFTIDQRGINIALEKTPAATERGFITHTNISAQAYAGGEVWFTSSNSVYINPKSARFGGASLTEKEWGAVKAAWEKIGYKVEAAEFKPPSLKP